jgi:hypothetical protein
MKVLFALTLLALPLAACHSSASEPKSGTPHDGGGSGDESDDASDDVYYDAVLPFTCSSTDDCLSVGLDADTCVYPEDGGCAAYGHCIILEMPANGECGEARYACPCSGDTQMIPACYGGYSPFAVASEGPCPVDAGTAGH